MNKHFYLSAFAVLASCSWIACDPGNGGDSKDLSGSFSEEQNTIAGVLNGVNGKPVAKVKVLALHAENKELASDTTDEKGMFAVDLSHRGLYGLSASKGDLAMYKVIKFEGKYVEVETKLDSTYDVSGSIVDGDDAPSEETYIALLGSKWENHTDSDGSFTIKKVPKGIYPVVVKPLDKKYVNSYYVVSVDGDGSIFYGPYSENIIESVYAQIESGVFEKGKGFKKINLVRSSDYGSVSLWNFDDLQESKSSMNSKDSKSKTDNIVFYGKPGVETGILGKAISLDGASQYGVIENDNDFLTDASALTLDAWVMVNKTPKGKDYRRNIVGKLGFGSKTDQDVFSLSIVQGVCGAKEPKFAFFIAGGNESDSLNCSEAVFSKGIETKAWSYISVVWANSELALYVNGKLVDKIKTSVKKIAQSGEPIIFGKENLNLRLDEVQIGTKAINELDVLFRYYSKGGVL